MNRRELIKALGAVGFTLPALEHAAQAVSVKYSEGPKLFWMKYLHAVGTESSHRPGYVTVSRDGISPLLHFPISTCGGCLYWLAPVEFAYVFLGNSFPVVKAHKGIDWSIPLLCGQDSVVIGSVGGRRYKERLYA